MSEHTQHPTLPTLIRLLVALFEFIKYLKSFTVGTATQKKKRHGAPDFARAVPSYSPPRTVAFFGSVKYFKSFTLGTATQSSETSRRLAGATASFSSFKFGNSSGGCGGLVVQCNGACMLRCVYVCGWACGWCRMRVWGDAGPSHASAF